MKNRYTTILYLIIISAASAAPAALPVLQKIELHSGERGFAVSFTADKKFSAKAARYDNLVKITFNDAQCKINSRTFDDFPDNVPVKSIELAKTSYQATFSLNMKMHIDSEIESKRIKNRMIFLISDNSFKKFTWSENLDGNSKQAEFRPGKNIPSVINDMSVSSSKGEESIRVFADSPLKIKVERKNGDIITVFENAEYNLTKVDEIIERLSFVNDIKVKQTTKNNIKYTGFVFYINKNQTLNISHEIYKNGLVIYLAGNNQNTEMVKEDKTDLKKKAPETSSEKEAPVFSAGKTDIKALQDITKESGNSVTVSRDRVNLRSEPSTESVNSIIETLPLGTNADLIERKGNWCLVMTESGSTGWIHSTMLESDNKNVTLPSRQKRDVAQNHVDKKPVNKKKKEVKYKGSGRDPFIPLDPDKYTQGELLDLQSAELVGILYDESKKIALLESGGKSRSISYALQENDPVLKGKLLRIYRDRVVFLVYDMGFSRTITLKMTNNTQGNNYGY